RISGRPRELASALRKLDAMAHRVPMRVAPAVAPLAIVNPLSALQGGFVTLFSTHPSTEERVRRLEAISEAARPS
ncbi:MAG TPA: protease HtpX, partial [Burkholderiales bacterium]|nr:protease HtpX [Burkholderiales bacterium]